VSIKSWSCPGCHRDFIVDAEAVRDTCPWCNVVVEDKSGALQVVSEGESTPETAAAASSSDAHSSSSGSSSSGTNNSGTQSWWPFEYSS
jgi:hypothetical protein